MHVPPSSVDCHVKNVFQAGVKTKKLGRHYKPKLLKFNNSLLIVLCHWPRCTVKDQKGQIHERKS